MSKCEVCGSTRKGDEFADGTGYECPDCFSNVFTDGEKLRGYVLALRAGQSI